MMSNDNNSGQTEAFVSKINQFAQNYIEELKKEQDRLSKDFPMINDLINDAIDRVYSTGRTPGKELKADVFKQKPIKLSQNVYLPVKQYPKFNFIGKMLGPKGNTLKRLHQETMCSIAIKGRHSMRDKEREEQLRESGDPAYNHLNKSSFIEISTVAPPAEAYARIAYALSEIRKYIIPDKNDEISQEQYRELMEIDPSMVKRNYGNTAPVQQKSLFNKIGFNGPNQFASNDNDNGYDEHAQDDSAPSYNRNYNNSGFQASPHKRTGPSSFVAKTKSFRNQPYQRNTPLKVK